MTQGPCTALACASLRSRWQGGAFTREMVSARRLRFEHREYPSV